MDFFKDFLFKIIAPMIWLMFFAYAFTFSGIRLVKAWKEKNNKLIWLYIWIILVGFYFMFSGALK
jgi:hypothetical protein